MRSALQTISAARLPSTDARVYAQLAAMAASKGEAWPRTVALASLTGMNERLVRRSLRALESRGLIASRVVGAGELLPSGLRVSGAQPIRVFRLLSIRIPVSDPDRTVRSGSIRIAQSATPYEDLDPRNDLTNRRRRLESSGHSAAGDGVAPGASPPPCPTPPRTNERYALGASPEGAAVMSSSSPPADAIANSPAPDSQVVVTDGERMDERRGSREDNKGGVAADSRPSDARDLRRIARRVLSRWAELLAAIDRPVVGPVHTASRLDVVVARLADGFADAELETLATYAVTSEWHLQKPTRLDARFLFRNAAEVSAVLSDAAAVARKRAAKRAAGPRRGVAGGAPSAGVQEVDSGPPLSREQMVTIAAGNGADWAAIGGAK